jgi:A/G-specific adenine glycosylase
VPGRATTRGILDRMPRQGDDLAAARPADLTRRVKVAGPEEAVATGSQAHPAGCCAEASLDGQRAAALEQLGIRLLTWYRRSARPLPWRETRDPWSVWLSEVLLQQTRAEKAEGYYRRLLAAYPSVEALARAPVEEVLGHWSGLGYYGRARRLHAAASRVAGRRGGIPSSLDELRRLPGVGEYTAAAVASIAYGVTEPVLDGNVERVVVRLLGLRGDPRKAAARQRLRETARVLLDPSSPGESNQALMELGALLCRPQRPACSRCPLESACEARRQGVAEELPPPRRRRRPERRRLVAALAISGQGEVLLFRRPEGSELLDGTWEVPWAPEGTLAEVERSLEDRYGGRWRLGEPVGEVRHSVTYRRLEIRVRRSEAWQPGAGQGLESGWFTEPTRRGLPRSSLVDKILAAARPSEPIA